MNWSFWAPVLLGGALATGAALIAYYNNKGKPKIEMSEWRVEGGFYPPVIGGGIVGFLAPLVTLIVSEDVRGVPNLVSGLQALSVLSLTAFLLAIFFTASAAIYKKDGKYEFTSRFYVCLHSFVLGLVTGMVFFSYFIIYLVGQIPAR